MASKSVNINTDQIQQAFNNAKAWLQNFFKTMDQLELYAVIAIGVGFVMFIVGLILL